MALAAALGGGCDKGPPGSLLEGPRIWSSNAVEAWVSAPAELPSDTLSVTLMIEGPAAAVLSVGVRDRASRELVDPLDPERSSNRLLRGRGTVVGMIPSATSSLPLSSNFAVLPVRLDSMGGPSDVPLVVSAWIKRSTGVTASAQELPLCSVLVGASVPAGDHLSVALAAVARIWRPAGIAAFESSRVRLETTEVDRFARLAVEPALGSDTPAVAEVLRLSARATPGCLALLLVPELGLAGSDQALWALAGAIPVPPVLGTSRSGVLVSAALVERDPLFAGQVIAHEIGHALGLYHPSEGRQLVTDPAGSPAVVHDPIDDTPACPATADRNPADGVLSANECRAFDADNLMFWSPMQGATRLTAGQAQIARRSALVH